MKNSIQINDYKEIPREYRQQIDLMRFMGLKQIRVFFKRDRLPFPEEPLTKKGVYALRHPLYLFTLMFLWLSALRQWMGAGDWPISHFYSRHKIK